MNIGRQAEKQNVRLRSPNRSNANNTWYVNSTGYVNTNNAYNANRFAPDCITISAIWFLCSRNALKYPMQGVCLPWLYA